MFEIEYQYFRLQEKEPLTQLNNLLKKGWEPVRETAYAGPSTAYTTGTSMLIVLKRHVKQSDVTVEEIPGELDSCCREVKPPMGPSFFPRDEDDDTPIYPGV